MKSLARCLKHIKHLINLSINGLSFHIQEAVYISIYVIIYTHIFTYMDGYISKCKELSLVIPQSLF